MKITQFEEIIAWQKAQDLAVEISSTSVPFAIRVLKTKFAVPPFPFPTTSQKALTDKRINNFPVIFSLP